MNNSYLIEPALNLLSILNKDIKSYSKKELAYLHNKWVHCIIELYNSKTEFILIGNTGTKNAQKNLFKRSYRDNYKICNWDLRN